MPVRFDTNAFSVVEEAPAKINLALHVTGLRDDGYHLLDMLVTFTRLGDRIGFRAAETDGLDISGPFSAALTQESEAGNNLILRARDLLRAEALRLGIETAAVHIHLEKNLPIASGIGGGSADAAATLRGLARLWALPLDAETMSAIALRLGADVPMCLESRPLIARGIGERLERLAGFPAFAMVLGNPLVSVSTPAVFRSLARKDNPAFSGDIGEARSRTAWLETISSLRNDLEPPARALCADIETLSGLLAAQGASVVRMSGSGATCFGIFDTMEKAQAVGDVLHSQLPGWYFRATETLEGGL